MPHRRRAPRWPERAAGVLLTTWRLCGLAALAVGAVALVRAALRVP